MKRVLITGILGFTGNYLLPHLVEREGPSATFFGLDIHGQAMAGVEYLSCDMVDRDAVRRAVVEIRPDEIYHLVGSFTNNYEMDYACNLSATKNLLDALYESGFLRTKILVIGSAAEYGLIHMEDSVTEEAQLVPSDFYGLTKVFQTYLAQGYVRWKGLHVVIARPFNIIGKGISNRLFVGHLYEQIQDFRKGRIRSIPLGELNGRRDFVDVRDVVAAYAILMEKGTAGKVYNIGRGELITMEHLLHLFMERFGIPRDCVWETKEDRRDGGSASFKADNGRLRGLGWEPTIDLAMSVRLMYEAAQ